MYYLFDFERGMWWKPNAFGYTDNVFEAGKFSFDDAKEKTVKANHYEADNRLPNTAMVPVEDYKVVNCIRCPVCAKVSYNLNDIIHGYCSACDGYHKYFDPETVSFKNN